MPNINKWTSYWRNTLADGERIEIAPHSMDAGKVLYLKAGQYDISAGNINIEKAIGFFKNLNRINEEVENNSGLTSIPVLISLFSIVPIAESAIETEENVMYPFWIKAILNLDGSLLPDEEKFPYIPRAFLEPQLIEKYFYTFSDVETIDKFFYYLDNGTDNWSEYWAKIQDVFRKITQQEIEGYKIENYQTIYGFTLVINDSLRGASDGIIKLYDFMLKNGSRSKLYENIASEEFPPNKQIRNIGQYEDDTLLHYGQMNYEYPMSFSQRNALYHFVHSSENEIFALNGPPGTGKTTLLQSVVANEFVKKAIEGTVPSIIVASSTNNQAVVNIIDSFTKAKTRDGKLAGRWLPDFQSYGLYLVALNRDVATEISPDILYYKYTGEGFPAMVQNPAYVAEAKAYFLNKFEKYAGYRENQIKEVVNELRKKLLKLDASLKTGINHWKEYKKTLNIIRDYSGKSDDEKYFNYSELKTDVINLEHSKLKQIQSNYLEYLKNEPWWQKLLIIFFKKERAANLAACFNECPIDYSSVNFFKLKTIIAYFRVKYQLIDEIKNLNEKWNKWKVLNNINGNPPLTFDELREKEKWNQNYFYNELETGMKHEAFQLATHYWEGRWLIEMGSMDAEELRRNNEECAIRKWQRFAMLTPCFVSTFYMIPKFFTYSRFLTNLRNGTPSFEAPSLIGGIDLLIVDEAGQVATEVGAASFTLAKKAIVVGDIKQIEPVWNVASKVDYSNLIRYDLIEGEGEQQRTKKLDDSGYLGSTGSIMKLAQKSCNYQLPNLTERGFLLTEHRRCYDEIIEYCNILAYNNQLDPKRGPSKNEPFGPMSLIHVEGKSIRINLSRANKEEASAIAEWIKENSAYILAFYSKQALKEYEKSDKTTPFNAPALKDLLGILTPFTAQKYIIRQVLRTKGINTIGMKIGTVHALQGAERPIVIFSTVYSNDDIGKGYFFDRDNKPNLLNVAVSRAKDCFIVFGNRHIFRDDRKTPSSKLFKYLKEVE